MTERTVRRVVQGRPALDGAGVHLVRILGATTVADFDPFLMLDAFDSTDPEDYVAGFPLHPHRGIETFTYLLDGEIEHRDSLGHQGRIRSGSGQWMTAGRGILHEEMPRPTPRLRGLQLWINLAARDKMVPPCYRDLLSDAVPTVSDDGVVVRVVTGRYGDVVAPVQGEYLPVRFLDVTLPAQRRWSVDTPAGHTVFAYGLEGSCTVGAEGPTIPARHAVLFSDGDRLTLRADSAEARIVLVSAPPLHEPVAWGGPVVMNTEAELRQAFHELKTGTFIRP